MKILLKFPSRSRPDRFFACLDNIQSNAVTNNYIIVATLDTDDATMNNHAIFQRLKNYPKVTTVFGHSQSKIHAINRGIDTSIDWDILCLHSDDMFFTCRGFDFDIIEAMRQHFSDTDGMLHFPDQKAGATLCTYQIVGRKYYDRQGYIYNPNYTSLWADNEEMEKAKQRGKYAFIDKQIIEHRHPFCGFGKPDALLKKTEAYYKSDRAIFLKRQAENFEI